MVRWLNVFLLTLILTACGGEFITSVEQAVKPTAKLDCFAQCKADCHDSRKGCLRDCKKQCRSVEELFIVDPEATLAAMVGEPEPTVEPIIPQAHIVMGHTYPKGAALDRAGRILIVGYYMTGETDAMGWQDRIFAMRLLSDGSRDQSFGTDGVVNLNVPVTAYGNNAGFVVVEADDGYWIAGNFSGVQNDGRIKDVFWTRLDYSGAPLLSTQTLDLGYDEAVYAVSLDAEGGLLLTGARSNGFLEHLSLRISPDGALESVQTDASMTPPPSPALPITLTRSDGSTVAISTIVVDGKLGISISK